MSDEAGSVTYNDFLSVVGASDGETKIRIPTDEKTVREHFEERISRSRTACEDAWKSARGHHRFIDGGKNQWDAKDFTRRTSRKQPVFTVNDCALAVNGMSGREYVQRHTGVFLSRDKDDDAEQGWVDVLQDLDRQTIDRGNVPDIESDAFRDLLIQGVSWVSWELDRMTDWRGRIVARQVPLWEMMWDHSSREPNLLDRDWDAQGYWMSADEFVARFPDKRQKLKDENFIGTDGWIASSSSKSVGRWPWVYRAEGKTYDTERKAIFASRYQWRELEGIYVVDDGTGNPSSSPINQEDWDKQILAWEEQGVPVPAYIGPEDGLFRWVHYEAWLVGKTVLQQRPLRYGTWSRVAMTGWPYKQPEGTEWRGLIHLMEDPARFKNSVISLGVSHLQRSRKGGMITESDAFEDITELEENISSPFPILLAKPGAVSGGKFMFLPENQYPQGMDSWLRLATEAVWTPTGINPASLGQIDDLRRITSSVYQGVAETPQITLAQLFASLRAYRRESARLRLRMYAEHYDAARMAEVVGQGKAAYIPPPETWVASFDRDVIVEEDSATKSEKLKFWDWMVQTDLIGKMIQGDHIPMDLIAQNAPGFNALDRQRWVKHLHQNQLQRAMEVLPTLPPEEQQAFIEQLMQFVQAQGAPGQEQPQPPQ